MQTHEISRQIPEQKYWWMRSTRTIGNRIRAGRKVTAGSRKSDGCVQADGTKLEKALNSRPTGLAFLLFTIILCSSSTLILAQDAGDFFPHKLGNKWVYSTFDPQYPSMLGTRSVTQDSLLPNGYYLVRMDGRPYLFDPIGRVYSDTSIQYDFTATMKSWWVYRDTVEVDTIFNATIFGIRTDVIVFNTWFGAFRDLNNGFVFISEYFGRGFGLVQKDFHEAFPFPRREYLVRAIIDDVRFGTLTTAEPHDAYNSTPSLEQNYPNPFDTRTSIGFSVPKRDWVRLVVYDLLGREVITLVDGGQEIGKYSIVFNGNELQDGIYFYRLIAGSNQEVKKMILRK